MSLIRRIRDDSAGTTIVVFSLILVLLLAFSAIAVDGAAAWAQRRQNQSGADTGALAGGILIGTKPTAQALVDATDEVIRITYETMDPDMTLAEWTAAWSACTDPERPAEYTLVGTSPCVSFSGNLRKIRVNMPRIDVATTFGSVLGRDFISTGAAAEAGTEATFSGGVLPFGLPAAVAGDSEVCLKSGSNPNTVAPCDGPDSGNFGALDITEFGPVAQCTGDTTGRLARNIMEGADHFLDTAPGPSAVPLIDRDVCAAGDYAMEPYTVTTETGNMTGVLHEGLITGNPSEGIPGRLTRGSNTITIEGNTIDHTPLWSHLTPTAAAACGNPASKQDMLDCLDDWEESDGVIFEDSLEQSPRWAWVPLFWENDLGSGNTDRTIREFRPVYIQTTLWKCNSSSCKYIHDPGEALGGSGAGGGTTQIEALSAIQIPFKALPTKVQESLPGTERAKEFLLLK